MLTRSHKSLLLISGSVLLLAGCNKGESTKAADGPPAIPVQVQTAQLQRVANATEYLATVRSRNSAVIQPQVEGHVTKIYIAAGDHVKAGEPLLQIDPLKQEATVSTQEATQKAKLAGLEYARRELERRKRLATEGVISRQELDQAQMAYDAAKADVEASQASVIEQKQQLRYYTVAAPHSGIVGDIPVRVGDRVETSTQLTTLDSGGDLELYISVPAERAGDVRSGTRVEVVPDDPAQKPLETRVNFISPRLDEKNQLLLVKAPAPESKRFRNEQLVHTRVVWNDVQAVVLPFAAVSRLAGSHFAFVAEKDAKGTVAKQRRLEIGDMAAGGYVVIAGIKAGEQVIVSNVQILADGMPVMVQAAPQNGGTGPGGSNPGGAQ